MPPVGFEPTISVSERLQTYALDRAATGTGKIISAYVKLIYICQLFQYTRKYLTFIVFTQVCRVYEFFRLSPMNCHSHTNGQEHEDQQANCVNGLDQGWPTSAHRRAT